MGKTTLTILYKSGQKIRVKVDKFSLTRKINGGLSAEWAGMTPKPLLFGIDDIEAIWEGKV